MGFLAGDGPIWVNEFKTGLLAVTPASPAGEGLEGGADACGGPLSGGSGRCVGTRAAAGAAAAPFPAAAPW
jgi:hypothetical protein